jgi:biopolymer transport protein ExbD
MLLQRQTSGLADIADDHLDMTPMVDVTFQLLTFLLLTWSAATAAAVSLPMAQHGVGIEENGSTVLTVARPVAEGGPAVVYEGTELEPSRRLANDDAIRDAVERGLTAGRARVILQADGDVTQGEVLRVAGAAAQVEGISVHIGVEEPK